ncbi:MAG: hypothetical protein ACI4IW_01240 [Oscillospiraceae bacterium]
MEWTPLIYDAAAVLIVVLCIMRGAKDGFAKTFVQTVGCVLAVIASLVVGRVCASLIYTTAIQPGVISSLENSVANAVDTESVITGLETAVSGLPAISRLLFDFSGVEESLSGMVNFNAAKIAAGVEESVIRPVVEPLLETVIFVVVFLILLSVVTLLAKGSKTVNKVPVIGRVNGFFGGVVGGLNGLVTLVIASAVLRLIMSIGGQGEFISERVIANTYLFKWIYFAVCGDTFLKM